MRFLHLAIVYFCFVCSRLF